MANNLPKPKIVDIMTPKKLRCEFSRQVVEERMRYPGVESSRGDPGMLYDAYSKVYSAIVDEMSQASSINPIIASLPDEARWPAHCINSYRVDCGLHLSGVEFKSIVRAISNEDLRGDIPIAIAAFEEIACYDPGTILRFGGKPQQTISIAGNNSQFFRGLANLIEKIYYNTGVLYSRDQPNKPIPLGPAKPLWTEIDYSRL
jgi:hypothetical protein